MRNSLRYTASPLLADKTPVWRSRTIVGGLALAFTALVARAAYVQVIDSEFFKREGNVRFVRTLELPASRGRIFDRNGLLLASSVLAPGIWAVPEDVRGKADEAQLKALARLLDMPLADLHKRIDDEDRSFVWLKRQTDEPVARQIAELKIPGIHQMREYKRKYPEGEAAAHVVGFADVENKGLEGAELSFESQLVGRPGSRRVIKDRLGRAVEAVGEEIPPVDGRDVHLSIDSKIQFFAYQKLRDAVLEHRAKSGSVVVLDAWTGELLALANYPSYTPDNRKGLSGAKLRNIAITDTFEPGSVMKPITVAAALEAGVVKPRSVIQTSPGSYQMGRFTVRDTRNYGALTVEGVVQKSSNIGSLKIGQKLGAQQLWETYTLLGYGQKPEVSFPGVASGRLRHWQSWRPVEQATMSYGYGLSASLLQMAHSYTAFARDGVVIPVTLERREPGAPIQGVRVFSGQTAQSIRHMLELAAGPEGTGQRAQTLGYSVGGKSGTARKQEGKGYATNKYRAWFAGMAPIDKPRVIVAVMVDEPSKGVYYGGAVAAPVFSEVVQQTLRALGVPPDMAVQPQIVANQIEESF